MISILKTDKSSPREVALLRETEKEQIHKKSEFRSTRDHNKCKKLQKIQLARKKQKGEMLHLLCNILELQIF